MGLVVATEHLRQSLRLGCQHRAVHDRLADGRDIRPRFRDDGVPALRKHTEAHGEGLDGNARETTLLGEHAQPLRRGLIGCEPALAQPGARRWEGIEHHAAADRGHRRERTQHETVAATRHQGTLQDEPGETRLPRTDGPNLDHAGQHLRRAKVDPQPSPGGDRLPGHGEKLHGGIEHHGGAPSRPSDDDVTALELLFVHPDQGQCGAPTRYGALRRLSVHLDRAHPRFPVEGQEPHRAAHRDRAGPGGSGDDGPRPGQREHPVDRQPEEVVGGPLYQVLRDQAQGGLELIESFPRHGGRGHGRRPVDPASLEPLGDLGPHQVEPVGFDEVPLGDHGNPAPHAEQLHDREVLFGLGHDPFVGRDHEQRDVDARRAGEHVAHEALVARHVHHARLNFVTQRERSEAKVDGDPPALLLLPAIGVDPGEGLHERRLAVVDVTGRADYEAADGTRAGDTHG